jgi:predicted RecB family nuclease
MRPCLKPGDIILIAQSASARRDGPLELHDRAPVEEHMRKLNGSQIYSPSDLITFMESEYASWMDRFYLECPDAVEPDKDASEDRILQVMGEQHERAFLRELVDGGHDVFDLKGARDPLATVEAMRDGHGIIYQGMLALDSFAGIADFLVRVDGSSILGSYHYEVWDTKLARKPKPYFVIQLCCYSEMLEGIQRRMPSELQVILGTRERCRFRTEDYLYYYRQLKRAFLERQMRFERNEPPDIPGLKGLGRWSEHATKILEACDSLSLIAGIRSTQIRRLRATGIETARALAETTCQDVPGITRQAFDRVRRQARLQVISRALPQPKYELLQCDPLNPRLGLAALPPASASDIFFDIEGYPLLEDGLEYLFGATYLEDGRPAFRDWWAHNREQERTSLEAFVKWAHERWRRDPSMHVYHYAAYEVTALVRLMGRYGVCEEEVDELLRNEVFVDLFSVVRQGLLVGEPSYSLKNIEKLYQEERSGNVASGGDSLVFYQRWLEDNDGADWTASPTLRSIREYNREDCESTWKLAGWLRGVQQQAGIAYVPKATVQESEIIKQVLARAKRAEEMRAEIPVDRDLDPERWRVHELLSWFLEFHRRESKPIWRAKYERHAMTEQQLTDDPDCLGGLTRTGRPPDRVKRSYSYEYRFDPGQETRLHEGSKCIFAHDLARKGTMDSFNASAGLLTIKLTGTEPPERLGLIPDEWVNPAPIEESIARTVDRYRKTGRLTSAIEDFLFRRRPRLRGRAAEGRIIPRGTDLLAGSIRAAIDLDESTLCIQGPPGSGKTYTAAHMIVELLQRGKRIGITSNSHRAICLLLNEVARLAEASKHSFRGVKIGGDDEDHENLHKWIERVKSASDVFNGGLLPRLIGGTAWAFSCPEAEATLDYLFVDEAGQVSVANLVGIAPSTRNIVLIGDQMQLSQPIKGSHPGESGTSALEYLLQGRATIADDFGIFLSETWRLHPGICSFISGAVYEDRLKPKALTAHRTILFDPGPRRFIHQNAGVLFVPVQHEGNSYESEEEAAVIVDIVEELSAQSLTDVDQSIRRLGPDDILVVTPYNLQVGKLIDCLPGVRIGTVDKFQGQQAPVVIYSMCASSGDASPRGIEFLFSKNRLNVAISRAQTLAIVVGNPALARTRCSTLEQIQLVNVFCRAVSPEACVAAPTDSSA